MVKMETDETEPLFLSNDATLYLKEEVIKLYEKYTSGLCVFLSVGCFQY